MVGPIAIICSNICTIVMHVLWLESKIRLSIHPYDLKPHKSLNMNNYNNYSNSGIRKWYFLSMKGELDFSEVFYLSLQVDTCKYWGNSWHLLLHLIWYIWKGKQAEREWLICRFILMIKLFHGSYERSSEDIFLSLLLMRFRGGGLT